MRLVIDIGNSNIVFGVSEGNEWVKIRRIQTDPLKTADEYEVIFRSLLNSGQVNCGAIETVVISSVVPALVRTFREMIMALFAREPLLVAPEIYPKLPVGILNPYEIGADLVANSVAVYASGQLPAMVIDFGTALTFTTMGRSGEILGVAIVPGLQTAIRSLAGSTAQLPQVHLQMPPSVLGKNTVHAIQAGIMFGYTGLVDSVIQATADELGESLYVIATGGLAGVMAPRVKSIHAVAVNLTLDGLLRIAQILEKG